MKLLPRHIQQIEKYLEKDKLFYDDIRHEMTDHIAACLEEELTDECDFNASLKSYINSYKKVKLLTAARQQETIRDKYYTGYFKKQFASRGGILFFAVMLILLYTAALIDVWVLRCFMLPFLIFIIWSMTGFSGLKSKYILTKRIFKMVQFFYVIPFIASRPEKYYQDAVWPVLLQIVVMAACYTSFYLLYKTNNYFIRKQYA